MARLRQLVLQFDAPMTIVSPRLAQALRLSQEQIESIHQIIQAEMPPPNPNSRPSWDEMMAQKRRATQQALAVLDQSQKSEWNKVTGAVFSNWEAPKPPKN
jgi:hypothetical protein